MTGTPRVDVLSMQRKGGLWVVTSWTGGGCEVKLLGPPMTQAEENKLPLLKYQINPRFWYESDDSIIIFPLVYGVPG